MSYVKFSMVLQGISGELHTDNLVPTRSPTHEERVDSGRKPVRSQPPTGVVLVRFGVQSRVRVTLRQRRIG